MTTQMHPTRPAEGGTPHRRRWLLIISLIVAVVVAVAAAGVIGAAANNHSAQVHSDQVKITTLQRQLTTAQHQAATAKAQAATAKAQATAANSRAATAVAKANTAAAAKYAARMAAAKRLLHKLQREQAVVSASTISQSGVYVIGQDIPAGVYHTSGGQECYYATLGSTNTSDILDNNNFTGPETVNVNGAYAFEIDGGCTWHKIG